MTLFSILKKLITPSNPKGTRPRSPISPSAIVISLCISIIGSTVISFTSTSASASLIPMCRLHQQLPPYRCNNSSTGFSTSHQQQTPVAPLHSKASNVTRSSNFLLNRAIAAPQADCSSSTSYFLHNKLRVPATTTTTLDGSRASRSLHRDPQVPAFRLLLFQLLSNVNASDNVQPLHAGSSSTPTTTLHQQ